MANLVGRTLGKYRLVARLGRGGMAEVYKAYQPGLDRYVGIKVLHSHLVDDEDFIGRFEREALATGKLRHPNIVQAVDFDRDGDIYFLAMEFIDGPTLKDEMKARLAVNKPFTLKEISRIFTALCSAIDYAHKRSMIHRDIKPANVMINQEGNVVLTDFGIARIMEGTQYTQTGALSGTPAYMSPEQGKGEKADERSDIYALGVMLYEMVTGRVPYEADTPYAVIVKHISESLPLPTSLNPDLPEAVERVILKAMSKEPNDRYQTAGEMARALRTAVELSPDDNLQNNPVRPIAPPPNVEEIEHTTDRLTAQHRAEKANGGGATVYSRGSDATTIAEPAPRSNNLPLIIGGAVVIVVLLGLVGYLALASGSDSTPTPDAEATAAAGLDAATATALAQQATVEAQSAQATAEFLAPGQTAEAAAAAETRTAATESAFLARNATLVADTLSTAQAGTVQAQLAQTAAAETATAEAMANATSTDTPSPTSTVEEQQPTPTSPPPSPTVVRQVAPPTATPLPTDTPLPPPPAITGKLAYPIDGGQGRYNVRIVTMPEGDLLATIQGARQPNFRLDGQKLLINGDGGSFGENVFEASPNGSIDRPVSGSPSDLFPVYKPDGTTLAYSNPQLAFGSVGYQSYLFVQCGLKPPSEDNDKCTAMADFGIIIPPGAIGDIIGSHPVWTTSDLLAYKGCNTWAGGGSCGIFVVGSWAVKRTSNGELPRKLADGGSLTPTDAKASLIAYMSRESGDWEQWVMSDNGAGAINISNSPGSQDGVGTISPDAKWIAFASNREGGWAIFVAPISGGEAQKLFDFPQPNPWITGDRDWSNERISWGP
ncbi:MAG: serine/threonine-protein kinase [Anaerolineaceae bacterium]|nr:serine/threonine-protein kinase [Anaerolineaceae bacterium]